MAGEKRRIRDPIHGLIVFDFGNSVDKLAWKLIQTKEFQRLRRIRQLGVSELVFPSATHTRFAHSIGVFHNARKLMGVIKRRLGEDFNKVRAKEVLIAALLHDLGHGPFSHAFEAARELLAKGKPIEKHEKFTAKLIRAEDGDVFKVLSQEEGGQELIENIARLIELDNPVDIYHAVVSSSFDADRLDYLERDRYMTGTKSGTIDYDWLIDNLTTTSVKVSQDDDEEPEIIETFVFKNKGRQAAEDFLLARFRLFTQIYLHKTTRGFEKLISALICRLGESQESAESLGLESDNTLLKFLAEGGDTIENYRELDDYNVLSTFERLAASCKDRHIRQLAKKLVEREPLKVLDVSARYGPSEVDVKNAVKNLNEHVGDKLGKTVFCDRVPYRFYSRSDGEAEKAHKTLRVKQNDGTSKEVTKFDDTIISSRLTENIELIRFYFLTLEEKTTAEKHMKGE